MREAISWLMKVPALPESNKIRTSLESINPLSLNVLFFLLAEETGCNYSAGLTAITTCPPEPQNPLQKNCNPAPNLTEQHPITPKLYEEVLE